MQTLKQVIKRLNGDPYQILETNPSEDFNSLKKKYRNLALKYHPDRNPQESAKEHFILINSAYEFLQKQDNRQLYQTHLKSLAEHRERVQNMDANRRKLIQDLKRREEQFNQRKQDMQQQLMRRKQFFDKKMKEQQEREKLRQEILQDIKPSEYYEELTSVKVEWQKGLSFSKFMLEKAFGDQYGKVTNIKLQPKHRQAIVSFGSIETCSTVVAEFKHPLIAIDFLVSSQRRQYLLKALKKQKTDIDFSLTTENLTRLKDVMNRTSHLYHDIDRKAQMEEQ